MIFPSNTTPKAFAALALRVAITALVFHVVAQRPAEGQAPASQKMLTHGVAALHPPTELLDLTAALTLHRTARTVFVDVRDAESWSRGRIKGAINLPLAHLQEAQGAYFDRPELREAVNVVVYCGRSSCAAGPLAAALLRRKIDGHVSLYSGGWEQWDSLGLPHEKD